MTAVTLPFVGRTSLAFDRQLSPRTVILVFALVAVILYAVWHHTVPAGAATYAVDADTMCFIYRFGLGGLCR